jgi:hypothetical protein
VGVRLPAVVTTWGVVIHAPGGDAIAHACVVSEPNKDANRLFKLCAVKA